MEIQGEKCLGYRDSCQLFERTVIPDVRLLLNWPEYTDTQKQKTILLLMILILAGYFKLRCSRGGKTTKQTRCGPHSAFSHPLIDTRKP
jgi:hypothetical protein